MKGWKKGWKAVLTAVLGITFVCVAPIAFFSGCFLVGIVGCDADLKTPWDKVIERELDLEIKGDLVEYTDDHGGFLGDGLTYICVDVSKSELHIEGTHGWNELPMTASIHTILYGSETHGALRESFDFELPDAQNGYYYFYDKQTGAYTDEGILGRPSYNFKFALYDLDEMKFYFIEFDT